MNLGVDKVFDRLKWCEKTMVFDRVDFVAAFPISANAVTYFLKMLERYQYIKSHRVIMPGIGWKKRYTWIGTTITRNKVYCQHRKQNLERRECADFKKRSQEMYLPVKTGTGSYHRGKLINHDYGHCDGCPGPMPVTVDTRKDTKAPEPKILTVISGRFG